MTDLTRIFAVRTLNEAASKSGYWKGQGYHVAVAGPTDAVRLIQGGGDVIEWESGTESDWYLVLASKSPLELVAAKIDGN